MQRIIFSEKSPMPSVSALKISLIFLWGLPFASGRHLLPLNQSLPSLCSLSIDRKDLRSTHISCGNKRLALPYMIVVESLRGWTSGARLDSVLFKKAYIYNVYAPRGAIENSMGMPVFVKLVDNTSCRISKGCKEISCKKIKIDFDEFIDIQSEAPLTATNKSMEKSRLWELAGLMSDVSAPLDVWVCRKKEVLRASFQTPVVCLMHGQLGTRTNAYAESMSLACDFGLGCTNSIFSWQRARFD